MNLHCRFLSRTPAGPSTPVLTLGTGASPGRGLWVLGLWHSHMADVDVIGLPLLFEEVPKSVFSEGSVVGPGVITVSTTGLVGGAGYGQEPLNWSSCCVQSVKGLCRVNQDSPRMKGKRGILAILNHIYSWGCWIWSRSRLFPGSLGQSRATDHPRPRIEWECLWFAIGSDVAWQRRHL